MDFMYPLSMLQAFAIAVSRYAQHFNHSTMLARLVKIIFLNLIIHYTLYVDLMPKFRGEVSWSYEVVLISKHIFPLSIMF